MRFRFARCPSSLPVAGLKPLSVNGCTGAVRWKKGRVRGGRAHEAKLICFSRELEANLCSKCKTISKLSLGKKVVQNERISI